MAPFIAALVQAGLPILANAVATKGVEVVKEKLGVDITELVGTSEGLIKLKQLEHQNEQWLIDASIRKVQQQIDAQKAEDVNITDRWKSDMASDSRLSKNIRPIVLIYLLTAYTLLAVLSGFGFNVAPSYVELLGQWGLIVMTAYFGGRTVEKVYSMIATKGKK